MLAWRCGYAGEAGGGVLRSHRLPWPPAAAAWVVGGGPSREGAASHHGSGGEDGGTGGGARGGSVASGAPSHSLVAAALGGLAARAGRGAALTRLVLSAEYGGEGAALPHPGGGMERFLRPTAAVASTAAVEAEVARPAPAAAAKQVAAEGEQVAAAAVVPASASSVEQVVAEAWQAAAARSGQAGQGILVEPWDEWEGEDDEEEWDWEEEAEDELAAEEARLCDGAVEMPRSKVPRLRCG